MPVTKEKRREQRIEERIARVRAAGWLSYADMATHCGYSVSQMRAYSNLADFPEPIAPLGGWKEKRWEKTRVDAFLRAHPMKRPTVDC